MASPKLSSSAQASAPDAPLSTELTRSTQAGEQEASFSKAKSQTKVRAQAAVEGARRSLRPRPTTVEEDTAALRAPYGQTLAAARKTIQQKEPVSDSNKDRLQRGRWSARVWRAEADNLDCSEDEDVEYEDEDGDDSLDFKPGLEFDRDSDADSNWNSDVDFHQDSNDESDEEIKVAPAKRSRQARNDFRSDDGRQWTPVVPEQSPTVQQSKSRLDFTEEEGPTRHGREKATSELNAFLCFVTPDMLLQISDYTNHEAKCNTDQDFQFEMTQSEMMGFIAVLLDKTMSNTKTKYFCGSVPVSMNFTHRRYEKIVRYLKFDDKTTQSKREDDRFAAIREIWMQFDENLRACFTPGQDITLNKQHYKYENTFWLVADLKTTYVCKIEPQEGTVGLTTEEVVEHMTGSFWDAGRTICMDASFTSLSLAEKLLQHNTCVLGAIKCESASVPPRVREIWSRNSPKTEAYQSGKFFLTTHQADASELPVMVLSSMHERVELLDGKISNVVNDYKQKKCGVDIVDHMLPRAASRRWAVDVFYNMVDIAVHNARILYELCSGKKIEKKPFIKKLVEQLAEKLTAEKMAISRQMALRLKLELAEEDVKKKVTGAAGPKAQVKCQVAVKCKARLMPPERCERCRLFCCMACAAVRPVVCVVCQRHGEAPPQVKEKRRQADIVAKQLELKRSMKLAGLQQKESELFARCQVESVCKRSSSTRRCSVCALFVCSQCEQQQGRVCLHCKR